MNRKIISLVARLELGDGRATHSSNPKIIMKFIMEEGHLLSYSRGSVLLTLYWAYIGCFTTVCL